MKRFAALLLVALSTACATGDEITVFTHCGFYEVEWNGSIWTPISIERGSMPDGVDPMATTGHIELVDEDRARFTAGDLEVILANADEDDLAPIPPCD